jgi:imidazolonepropionase-like amidohydrolase
LNPWKARISRHRQGESRPAAPARADQTLILRDGNIAELGDAAKVTVPAGATVIDLTGKSVLPGLVMLHEHLYYPTGPGVYGQLGESFVRLYLAGGVTTMRTAGNTNGLMDIVLKLIDKHVALTSTLTVFETFTPGRPIPPGIEVLDPELRAQFLQSLVRVASSTTSGYKALFPKGMALELAFAKAGGMLAAGTDPTGSGGVIPGYSDQRQIELLVEAGFTPIEPIKICTLNGAKYLGRDVRIGTIAIGKQADLMIVTGDPSTTIADLRKVETVFKRGIGFDPAKLISSVMGKVGLW